MARRPTTTQLPGAISVGDMGGLVRLEQNVTATNGQIIPNATPRNSGVMTKEQAARLESLTGGFNFTAQASAYDAAINDLVDADPTGGSFAVTLPAAPGDAGGAIIVKNDAVNQNQVTVAGNGNTIEGAASVVLTAQQSAYLVWDGVSNWIVISTVFLPPPWINATLLNGYAPLGGAFSVPRFYKTPDNIVFLDGAAVGPSAAVAFTLPAEYRPANQKDFIGVVDDTASIIIVAANGDVRGNSGGSTDILFNGISFPAE